MDASSLRKNSGNDAARNEPAFSCCIPKRGIKSAFLRSSATKRVFMKGTHGSRMRFLTEVESFSHEVGSPVPRGTQVLVDG